MTALEPGDIAPRFSLMAQDGGRVDPRADDVAGAPLVLVFADTSTAPALGPFIAAAAELGTAGVRLYAVVTETPVEGEAGFPVLHDVGGEVGRRYGREGADPLAVTVAPNQHVAGVFPGSAAPKAMALARQLAEHQAPTAMGAHPPVLILPEVLSPQDCKRLVSIYTLRGHKWVEPGHGDTGMTTDYKMRIPEYGRRDRIDHWILDQDTNQFIDRRLQSRLFPEIEKSFQYRVTRRETYRIGCYEGERGGEVHGHRDNTAPQVAHRRFAVSINLNTEEFEGGAIRFPEFGGPLYRPETGAAIAFSCSLLHEATEVTGGRRYVLLAFLFGDR